MTFLITVCLLIVIWYLARAGLYEKRWYEAHTDTTAREADEGVLGDLRDMVAPESQATGNSIDEDDSHIAKSAVKMQERVQKLGDRFEGQAQKILEKDESESLFGKVLDKVKGGNEDENVFNKVRAKVAAKGSDNVLERMASKVSEKGDFADRKIQAQRDAAETNDEIRAKEQDSFFGRMVKKVSSANEKFEDRVTDKMKASADQEKEDIISRMSQKVGTKINDLDDRAIESGRRLVK